MIKKQIPIKASNEVGWQGRVSSKSQHYFWENYQKRTLYWIGLKLDPPWSSQIFFVDLMNFKGVICKNFHLQRISSFV